MDLDVVIFILFDDANLFFSINGVRSIKKNLSFHRVIPLSIGWQENFKFLFFLFPLTAIEPSQRDKVPRVVYRGQWAEHRPGACRCRRPLPYDQGKGANRGKANTGGSEDRHSHHEAEQYGLINKKYSQSCFSRYPFFFFFNGEKLFAQTADVA